MPKSSLSSGNAIPRLHLDADPAVAHPGQPVVLTATADTTVTSTAKAIEIFDLTARTVVGACMQGSRCAVAYSAGASTHDFGAFITIPVKAPPTDASVVSSNRVTVDWVGLWLTAGTMAVAPGKTLTITAVASISHPSDYALQFFEAITGDRLSYCAHGTMCTMTLSQPNVGSHLIVAALAKPSSHLPAQDTFVQSDALWVTWLSASIYGHGDFEVGGKVYLTATTNAPDLTGTPWSLGIVDDKGRLVAPPCKSGNACSAELTLGPGSTSVFKAIIGIAQNANVLGSVGRFLQKYIGPTSMVNVQAQSEAVKPSRLLWGVDSCKSFTDGGLFSQVAGALGTPDFWGRYLTSTICPGISGAEVSAAHNRHIAILPIYNDFICSNVVGYDTAKGYATAAAAAARALGIPQGTGLAIDIEPPGEACPGAANIDTGFIHGWVDGMGDAHYTPIFYGDGTSGSEFATQWCVAVTAMPYIGERSYVWSFEPSLLGGFSRGSAPGFAPDQTGCAGHSSAWQYQLGSNSSVPEVDQDEATSELPLWYP